MNHSEQFNEIAAALAKAQGAFTNPPRNREVKVQLKDGKGQYTFAYATLDGIMEMIRKPLADNGLAILHSLDSDDKGSICETRLIHASGQWIACWVPVIVAETANAQGWGSAITYARRYGVTSLLAIASEEDDDSNAACGNEATGVQRAAAQRKPNGKPAPKKPEPPAAKVDAKTWATMDETEKGKVHSLAMNYVADHTGKLDDLKHCWLRIVALNMTGEALDELAAKISVASGDDQFAAEVTKYVSEQNVPVGA